MAPKDPADKPPKDGSSKPAEQRPTSPFSGASAKGSATAAPKSNSSPPPSVPSSTGGAGGGQQSPLDMGLYPALTSPPQQRPPSGALPDVVGLVNNGPVGSGETLTLPSGTTVGVESVPLANGLTGKETTVSIPGAKTSRSQPNTAVTPQQLSGYFATDPTYSPEQRDRDIALLGQTVMGPQTIEGANALNRARTEAANRLNSHWNQSALPKTADGTTVMPGLGYSPVQLVNDLSLAGTTGTLDERSEKLRRDAQDRLDQHAYTPRKRDDDQHLAGLQYLPIDDPSRKAYTDWLLAEGVPAASMQNVLWRNAVEARGRLESSGTPIMPPDQLRALEDSPRLYTFDPNRPFEPESNEHKFNEGDFRQLLGDLTGLGDLDEGLRDGDYGQAAFGAGMSILTFTPGVVFTPLAKGFRWLGGKIVGEAEQGLAAEAGALGRSGGAGGRVGEAGTEGTPALYAPWDPKPQTSLFVPEPANPYGTGARVGADARAGGEAIPAILDYPRGEMPWSPRSPSPVPRDAVPGHVAPRPNAPGGGSGYGHGSDGAPLLNGEKPFLGAEPVAPAGPKWSPYDTSPGNPFGYDPVWNPIGPMMRRLWQQIPRRAPGEHGNWSRGNPLGPDDVPLDGKPIPNGYRVDPEGNWSAIDPDGVWVDLPLGSKPVVMPKGNIQWQGPSGGFVTMPQWAKAPSDISIFGKYGEREVFKGEISDEAARNLRSVDVAQNANKDIRDKAMSDLEDLVSNPDKPIKIIGSDGNPRSVTIDDLSRTNLPKTLRNLRDTGTSRTDRDLIESLAEQISVSKGMVTKLSETRGEIGGEIVAEYEKINIIHRGSGPGTADRIGVKKLDDGSLQVVDLELKGGDGMSSRIVTIDGKQVRVQQGTPEYLRDEFKEGSDAYEALKKYDEDNNTNLLNELLAGNATIDYRLVRTDPGGKITLSSFDPGVGNDFSLKPPETSGPQANPAAAPIAADLSAGGAGGLVPSLIDLIHSSLDSVVDKPLWTLPAAMPAASVAPRPERRVNQRLVVQISVPRPPDLGASEHENRVAAGYAASWR
ncbi:hypothetical protein [Nocardia bovistercoris]|uniref:Uncharacterized protein n=1 Tax=Nocardia bovistercoris TaxID=2785916 RepID=A0A931I5M6_9NOCA|nr:hypothetical protein [Nocardia bovistercoris]MBH0775014.1 hypothetical protein [Nocardia bovistercoris]